MSHYSLLHDRRFPLANNPDRSYYSTHERVQNVPAHTSHWHHLTNDRSSQYLADSADAGQSFPAFLNPYSIPSSGWPLESAVQDSYRCAHTHQNSSYPAPTEYPSSPLQPVIALPSPSPLPPPVLSSYTYGNDLPRSPSQSPEYENDNAWGEEAYTPERSESPSPSSDVSPGPVKAEPDEPESCFIMELSAPQSILTLKSQSMAPPTEVPLRATGATPRMRKMMGVFRINPFTIHSGGGRGAAPSPWHGAEARPLEEEPLTFEFQMSLGGSLEPTKGEDLRSFSPGFELHGMQDKGDQSEWGDHRSEALFTPPSWDLEYPQSEEHFLPAESASVGLHPHRSPRAHNSMCPNNFYTQPITSSISDPPSAPSRKRRSRLYKLFQFYFIRRCESCTAA